MNKGRKYFREYNTVSGFAHILVLILAVLGISALGYFSWQNGLIKTIQEVSPTPTSNKIENWITHRGNSYEFKYPKDWTVKEYELSTRMEVSITESNSQFNTFSFTSGGYYDQTKSRMKTISERISETKEIAKSWGTELKEENIVINSIPASKISYKDAHNQYVVVVFFEEQDGFQWVVDASFPYDKRKSSLFTFDQILSTFKFIELDETATVQSEAESPNNKYKITVKTGTEFKKWVVLTHNETKKSEVVLSRGNNPKLVDIGEFGEVTPNNWSSDSFYFFIQERFPDSGELYVFKSNGENFNGKEFLKASEIGYDNRNSLVNAKWLDNNAIQIETANVTGKGPVEIINVP